MRNGKNRQLAIIRELLDTYSEDPAVVGMRKAASNWVMDRLGAELFREHGLSEEQIEAFIKNQEPESSELESFIIEELGLSREIKRRFIALLSESRKLAFELVLDYLKDKKQVAFRKKTGIAPARWKSFLDASSYTGSENLKRISQGLGLSKKEETELFALVIRENFPVSSNFKTEVRARLTEQGFNISDFQMHSFISMKAWEPFREESKDRLTSQGTLLKMLIGFALDEERGRSFLAKIGSSFIVRRDLVVLACINCGIYDVYELHDILEFFSEGSAGERLYQNLYKFC